MRNTAKSIKPPVPPKASYSKVPVAPIVKRSSTHTEIQHIQHDPVKDDAIDLPIQADPLPALPQVDSVTIESVHNKEALPPLSDHPAVLTPPEEDTLSGDSEFDGESALPSLSPTPVEPMLQLSAQTLTSLKHSYILGKKTRRDIFDGNEQLIVAADEAITLDVLAHAERAGKLIELIVQLKPL